MQPPIVTFSSQTPLVVGSFGSLTDLTNAHDSEVAQSCDLIEIRLDILLADGANIAEKPWSHLRKMPILFTARRKDEGGKLDLSATDRDQLIATIIDDASIIDIELRSLDEMSATIARCRSLQIPWICSFHDFSQVPAENELIAHRESSRNAGAAAFKVAVMLHDQSDITKIEHFQQQSTDYFISSMGMGALAPESRVRCAHAGSVLNYGYIGQAPTAPGQWTAAALREAIHRSPQP
jgi:3-dehydroquinate dehydratase type I